MNWLYVISIVAIFGMALTLLSPLAESVLGVGISGFHIFGATFLLLGLTRPWRDMPHDGEI